MTDRVIRVVLDPSGIEAGARRAGRPLQQIQQRSAGVERGLKAAARAATALVGALSARELIRTADTYNRIQNRLRIVTDSTEQLTQANERLFAIAQDTRQPLEATVELFTRASIAADELGASEEELFRLTEITGQALAVQGGAASEASGALRQLSQSFASGIVRAEEFNSILEGAFPLAQAAARGFDEAGGSVGRLRQLVVEGEVSSREFFEAILEGGGELEAQFAQTVPTVSQAITTLQTSFITLVGEMDDTLGITDALASGIVSLSADLTLFGDAVLGTLGPTDELSVGLERVSIAGVLVGTTFTSLFDLLGVLGSAFRDFGENLGGIAAAVVQTFEGNFAGAGEILSDLSFDDTQASLTDFFESVDSGATIASERISQILLPTFRELKDVQEELSGSGGGGPAPIIPDNAVEDVSEARDAVNEFLAALEQEEAILGLTRDSGEQAAEAIRQYKEDLALASAEAEIFGDLQPTEEIQELQAAFRQFGEEAIASQRELRAEIEAADLAATFDDQIDSLEEEIALLGADTEALAQNAEARALAAGATQEQAAQIGQLTETLANEREALAEEQATLQGFFEEAGAAAQRSLSGFLADPLSEGLDELPGKFAQVLQELAAQALASEIFSALGGLFTGGAAGGGGAGGFVGAIGSFFGGRAAGGSVTGGRPVMVGERGPEIFEPPGSGNIVPNVSINQAAQAAPSVVVNNITDPADIPAGLRTSEGEEEVINIIQRNPDAVRRILG